MASVACSEATFQKPARTLVKKKVLNSNANGTLATNMRVVVVVVVVVVFVGGDRKCGDQKYDTVRRMPTNARILATA
jgi:hypothetical protein